MSDSLHPVQDQSADLANEEPSTRDNIIVTALSLGVLAAVSFAWITIGMGGLPALLENDVRDTGPSGNVQASNPMIDERDELNNGEVLAAATPVPPVDTPSRRGGVDRSVTEERASTGDIRPQRRQLQRPARSEP